MPPSSPSHLPVIIVGGGQAGLSMSACLQQSGIEHLVLEKHSAMHVWRTQRWDNFCLVTPNWQCALPGHAYEGPEPHGFMKKDEINAWLDAFRRKVNPPLREGVSVQRVTPRPDGGFHVSTSVGDWTADQVVVASGGYHVPIVPRMAERFRGFYPVVVDLETGGFNNQTDALLDFDIVGLHIGASVHELMLQRALERGRTLNARLPALRFRSNLTPATWDQAVAEHRAMIEALAARDGAADRQRRSWSALGSVRSFVYLLCGCWVLRHCIDSIDQKVLRAEFHA
mgnify:CR=1 FL=1